MGEGQLPLASGDEPSGHVVVEGVVGFVGVVSLGEGQLPLASGDEPSGHVVGPEGVDPP